jgi:hypothetical protein
LAQPQVVDPTGLVGGDADGITDHQRPDPVLDGEGDGLIGGLVVGLADAAAVACLDPAQSEPMATPAARTAVPGPGCPSGRLGLASLLVA